MELQVLVDQKKVYLKLFKNGEIVCQKRVDKNSLSENLLISLDKFLKENRIKKEQLEDIEVVLEKEEDSSSVRLARIFSVAGGYCLTKLK